MKRARHMVPLVFLVLLSPAAPGREIGFVEDFSLAEDRDKALDQLVPGTDDYYFYHGLHYQNTNRRDAFQRVLNQWVERRGHLSERARELKNRQALLDYERDPEGSLRYIQQQLGLRFDHRRATAEAKSAAPTHLDAARISVPVLRDEALEREKDLSGFEDAGLKTLADMKLDAPRRRLLLGRLVRPDYPGLVDLVARDLQAPGSRGFGSMPVHEALLLDQMAGLARRMPELLKQDRFVRSWAAKLCPSDDVDIEVNTEARAAYLDRLWSFVQDLDPVHASLQANVLYHRLAHDRALGLYDAGRFMRYIRIPRNAPYVKREFLAHRAHRDVRADLNADYGEILGLTPVRNDLELVRDYLSHFLRDAESFRDYAPFLRDTFLTRVFAETKIVNGVGDPEAWASLLSSAEYRELKERVDLAFAPTNAKYFAPGEPVALDVFVKNVESLIIRVYELNTCAYFREKRQEVDLAVNLEGVVATHEERHRYEESPFRRIRRSYTFPVLQDRGVYVVELIGNGRSSRALIQKGRLRFLEEPTPAGHGFRVLDEENRDVLDARAWVAGHEYLPEENGIILVPYTAEPGEESVVLSQGDFCSHGRFRHLGEVYRLSAGFYIDREALWPGAEAALLVRPVLTLNGLPVSLDLLEEVSLSIESIDHHGDSTRLDVPAFSLSNKEESVHRFQVPRQLAHLSVTLKARVQNVSRNEKENLQADAQFLLNGIDTTEAVADLHVMRAGDEYVAEFLGKNGERRPHMPVKVELKHRFFKRPVHATLSTDRSGRCTLGPLRDITWFRLQGPDGHTNTWTPARDERTRLAAVHGVAGEPLRIPHMAGGAAEVSLIEKAGGRNIRDHSHRVVVGPHFLELPALPAGDYDLLVEPSGARRTVRLTEGTPRHGHLLSSTRALRVRNAQPLQVEDITAQHDQLTIQLAHAGPETRVHVFAGRYQPDYSAFESLAFTGLPEPALGRLGPPPSFYAPQREIGGEYRYILDRQDAGKYPGVMLERPGLLLNPWSVRKTSAAVQVPGREEALRSLMATDEAVSGVASVRTGRSAEVTPAYANLDFLARPSAVFVNLRPDENGRVVLARSDLGDKQQVRVVAVDPWNTVFREVSLAAAELETRDLRLGRGLEPDRHYAQQKLVEAVAAGETLALGDAATSRFEVYDSLAAVFTLFATLSDDPTLGEFRFLLGWPGLSGEERQRKYSKYACHELNLFLYHKDRDFFDRVIAPYLRNKKDKTFVDRWLLGEDLAGYLEPWAFQRLNVAEQVLLARRLPDALPGIRRHVTERFDLLPPDVELFNRLFDTALKGGALERRAAGSPGSGFGDPFAPEAQREMNEYFMGVQAAKEEPRAPDAKRRAKSEVAASAPPATLLGFGRSDTEMDSLADARQRQRSFFRQVDKTEEWAENNYYQRPVEEQDGSLITVNAFWRDYVLHEGTAPFLSVNFPYAAGSFAEVMLALAVLDLPFEAGEHETLRDGDALRLRCAGPLVVFHKQIREGAPADDAAAVLVTQHFFRADDRYGFEGSERYDKYVSDEFLCRVVYGCQVILTNPHSSVRKLNLLMQLPRGAVPVRSGFYTEGKPIRLDPFSTRAFEYYFYFPSAGMFTHFPVHVAREDQPVAYAEPVALHVVGEPSSIDTTSWAYVSQEGGDGEVLAFLRRHNLGRIDLAEVAFRARDRSFFRAVTDLVRERHAYDPVFWSYGLYHNDLATAREYLASSPYAGQCGPSIDTPLLTLDPVARHAYQHLEYSPLVHARAHRLGQRRQVLNDRLYEQYHAFLGFLSYRAALSDEDRLAATYYLLLQDRVDEALAGFERIDPGKLPSRLQFDYLQVCLDLRTGDLRRARATAAPYGDYPVPRWRNLFLNALAHLDEAEGHASRVVDGEARGQVQDELAATEPSFDFTVEGGSLTIEYRNLDRCRVNLYPMDVELLFSRNPFVRQQSAHFSFVRAAESLDVPLPGDQRVHVFPLPGNYRNLHVMVDVVAGSIRKSQAHYANALSVQVIENYGQVSVLGKGTATPQPGVYVKVYARMNDGEVRFYKDGYTDLRGRFDYVSLSTDDLERVERFALLVLSENDGAVVKEAEPPKR